MICDAYLPNKITTVCNHIIIKYCNMANKKPYIWSIAISIVPECEKFPDRAFTHVTHFKYTQTKCAFCIARIHFKCEQ